MTDINNDDLLNELNSMPAKKGKKGGKGAANKPKEEIVETPVVEEKPLDTDDLLNELNSMQTKKGKGKGKGKVKEEEPIEVNIEVKTEVKAEALPKEAPKEEEKKEEDGEEEGEEKQDKGEKKKKKKKVVVKGKKKEDLFLKAVLGEAKKKKELEEQRQREIEEQERIRKEEEERQRKIEEEKRLEEERQKQAELDRLKEFKSQGIKNLKELQKLDQKKNMTMDKLKQQGFTDIDEFMETIKHQKHYHKKKPKPKKQEVTQQEKEENEEEEEEREEEINTQPKVEEKPNEELLKYAEKEVTFNIKKDTEALDDWENFEDEEETPKVNESTTTISEKEENKITVDNKVELVDNKKRGKAKEKKFTPEEPEYIPQSKLRAPIICILGHVDTGKTKILDKLRKTNVQEGEAGGITQQIGATFFPIENFTHHLEKIPEKFRIEPKIPGFLVIDTPGHESFQNLRSRGSSLCDLAVLVVDLMHGMQKQTLDSLEMLKRRKTPFIIALNKIDRVYQWKSTEWGSFRDSFEVQKKNQTREFNDRLNKILMQLVQNNLNVALYDENPSMKEYINIVPTSAITGEGMPDLIGMFVYLSQKFLTKKIEFKEEVQCSILEVKVLEGVGTTIDVILVNGTLKVGDKIVIGGLYGPIKTAIKILLTPHPMKEMRVKSEFETHESISGAMGVKVFATELENALAGSPLFVYKTEEEAERYMSEISQDFNSIVKDYLSKSGNGIMVQASTLGSLEAILSFLHDKKIPIAAVGLGTLQKKDVIKLKTIHSKNENPYKEHLTILAFDIKVHPDAKQFAEENGVKIFTADIIYHLFDSYVEYEKQCIAERKKEKEREAVFPCILKTIPNAVFNRKDPIIIGVDVVDGILKIGTPLIVPEKKLVVGVVEGIESNKKATNNVRSKDGSVAIRIKPSDAGLTVGRQFDESDSLVSNVSYKIIYLLYFRFPEIL